MFKPEVFIDFDKTISPIHGFDVAPNETISRNIKKLKEKYKIIIFSCRGNPEVCDTFERIMMEDYLKKYDIPYDGIYKGKPVYYAIIDDRSYNPNMISWDEITKQLLDDTN